MGRPVTADADQWPPAWRGNTDDALHGVKWPPVPGEWVTRGRCRDPKVTNRLFFPERGDDEAPGKAVCERCPVIDECSEYALEHPALTGTWGGLSGRQRRETRRATAATTKHQLSARLGRDEFADRLRQLVDHPGRWAVVRRYDGRKGAATRASQLNRGVDPVPLPGRWSFEGHVDADGSELFARYDGAEEQIA